MSPLEARRVYTLCFILLLVVEAEQVFPLLYYVIAVHKQPVHVLYVPETRRNRIVALIRSPLHMHNLQG